MLAGPLLMSAALLAAAALAKLRAPLPTRTALYAVGLPSATGVVVALALVEVAIAAAVVVVGGVVPALVLAATYAGFAGFVLVGRDRLTSCGCFGRSDTPPGLVHVVTNGVVALTAVASVFDPVPAIDGVLTDQPWAGVPFLALVALGTALGHAVLTALPAALEHVGPTNATPAATGGAR